MNPKLITSLLFLLPIIAVMLHVISWRAERFKFIWQTVLLLLWLGLAIANFCTSDQVIWMHIGNWQPAFTINIVVDRITQLFTMVFGVVGACVNFYSFKDSELEGHYSGFFIGYWLLLLGVTGVISTADVFNLYVWLEVMLVSALTLFSTVKRLQLNVIFHYAIINIIGTLFMLLAIAMLYGICGSLSYAGIAHYLAEHGFSGLSQVALYLLVFALALKGGLFPLYFWLPATYPNTSQSTTQLLSAFMTKSVMLVLLRLFWLWGGLNHSSIHSVLLVVAWLTMLLGVLGAASQTSGRKILSFHIISQLGYIMLAILLPTKLAVVAVVYFLVHNMLVKSALFMTTAMVTEHTGDDVYKVGGMLKQHPWLATAFFLSAMSLAGIPPLSGFWAKLLVIQSTLQLHYYFSTFVAIFVSLFTLYSMIKIWRYLFCAKALVEQPKKKFTFAQHGVWVFALTPLILLPLVIGFYPDSLLNVAHSIALQLGGVA